MSSLAYNTGILADSKNQLTEIPEEIQAILGPRCIRKINKQKTKVLVVIRQGTWANLSLWGEQLECGWICILDNKLTFNRKQEIDSELHLPQNTLAFNKKRHFSPPTVWNYKGDWLRPFYAACYSMGVVHGLWEVTEKRR